MILLDEQRTLSLLKGATGSIPLLLVASIDAYSTAVYTKVKGFDRLTIVRQNLRRLLRLRRDLNAPVNIQLQFVVQDGNAEEARAFRTYWIDTLRCYGTGDLWHDEIMFKRLSVDGGAKGQQVQMHCIPRSYSRGFVMKLSMVCRFKCGSKSHGNPLTNQPQRQNVLPVQHCGVHP